MPLAKQMAAADSVAKFGMAYVPMAAGCFCSIA